jgi:hypothetical protein
MPERRIYHVIRKSDATWHVMKEGFDRPHFVRGDKKEAVILAKRLAKTHPESQVIVHDNDTVESQFSYHAY